MAGGPAQAPRARSLLINRTAAQCAGETAKWSGSPPSERILQRRNPRLRLIALDDRLIALDTRLIALDTRLIPLDARLIPLDDRLIRSILARSRSTIA